MIIRWERRRKPLKAEKREKKKETPEIKVRG
jgi:hypothetical protein